MPKVNVELNFFYLHYNDAKTFARWAIEKKEGDVNPSIYVRHAILSVVFASEALINRVLVEFSTDPKIFEILEKLSIPDKWYLAPYICSDNLILMPFIKGVEPFQSFKELVNIRNWLAHPKKNVFLDADLDPNSSIVMIDSKEEYPWLEMLKGDVWNQTEIPLNPFELNYRHAESAIKILHLMIDKLQSKLGKRMSAEWLDTITVKDENGLSKYKAPVSTIWGGYGGTSS